MDNTVITVGRETPRSAVRIVTSLIVKFEGTTPRYLPELQLYFDSTFITMFCSIIPFWDDILILFISNKISFDTIDPVQ